MTGLLERVDVLEGAVVALASVQLGDSEGHPFRGNQWSGGGTAYADEDWKKSPETPLERAKLLAGLVEVYGSTRALSRQLTKLAKEALEKGDIEAQKIARDLLARYQREQAK